MDPKQKRKIYKSLPEEIRNFLSSDESIERTDKIAGKFSLTPEQDMIVDEEITTLLMGITTKENFIFNLQEKGKISKNKAVEILIDADNEIFQKYKQWIPKNNPSQQSESSGETLSGLQELPDGAVGSLPDHEEIIKNPITPPRPVSINKQPLSTVVPKQEPIKIVTPPMSEPAKPAAPQPELSWEERKKRAEEALKKVTPPEVKKYPGAADPYREPLS